MAETGDENNLQTLCGVSRQLILTATPNGHYCPHYIDEEALVTCP